MRRAYGLLLDIEGFAGVRLGPGPLDGAIGRLEERGLIEPVGEAQRRRPHRLTATGAEVLRARPADLGAIVAAPGWGGCTRRPGGRATAPSRRP